MGWYALYMVVLFVLLVLAKAWAESEKFEGMSHKQLIEHQAVAAYGVRNLQMVCLHCQNRGSVRTKPLVKKQGISGGKATAAVLTGGVSLLATGLSRREEMTQAHCDTCGNIWVF